MILKKLQLRNVRSYEKQSVDFPMGKTLFEGDIGSGKSTILMAIEFALFGLGSEKGASLLRVGQAEGEVSLTFEVAGNEYTITRTLVRRKSSVQQGEGTLETPEGILHLSASELKEKILEVLHFNEPADPKAQSVIYRYAVFTPQEEMKIILAERPDSRLQTLRKAFRLEDYKIAGENAKNVTTAIKGTIKAFDAVASEIPDLMEKAAGLVLSIETTTKGLASLSKEEKEVRTSHDSLKKEKEKLHGDEVVLSKAVAQASALDEAIRKETKQVSDHSAKIEELKKKVGQLDSKIKQQQDIKKPIDKTQEDLDGEIEKLSKQEKSLRKLQTQIESKADDYKSILEGKVCPTCDRPVKPGEFHSKLKVKESEAKKVTTDLKKCVELLEKEAELLERRREYDGAQEKLVELREKHSEYAKDIQERKEKIQELVDDIKEANRGLESAKKSIDELRELKTKLEETDARMTTVEKRLKELGEGIAAGKATVQNLTKEVEDYRIQIKKKEDLKKRAEGLKEHQIWVEDYFIPTLDSIEKHVMLSINQDFNAHFQKWFGALVEDPGKDARVDEEFTPIVEQDGYEQDVSYLSGGEKTSVALAYRLALNTMVKRVSTGMSSNLLILDEPTDGFSKEQLGKVREILDELDCPQTVIVSHEKELESFADQIFRVSKSQGESTIISGQS